MKAQTLSAALNVLDPERPLLEPEELEKYFVSRPMSPREDLAILLEDTTDPQKILFTGHRGSGKSTELAKLAEVVQDHRLVIRYSVKSVLNLFDLNYVDVVLSLALELIRQIAARDVKVEDDVREQVFRFTKEITREVEMEAGGGAEIGAELNVYVAKLSSKLRTEDTTRTTVREKVQGRLSDLLESITFLVQALNRHTGKRLLVIVEDLDKTDLDTARRLFCEHATSLAEPPTSIIYTFPTALRHDNNFMQIEMDFPTVYVLPNMKTRTRDDRLHEPGIDDLREILMRRVEEALFAPDALTELASLSSGIPRELIALARQACLEARKSRRECVTSEDVQRAAQRKRMSYEVLLDREQLKLLERVRDTKAVNNDEAHRALLHNLSVLEYRNDHVWYDVHPLVTPLLGQRS